MQGPGVRGGERMGMFIKRVRDLTNFIGDRALLTKFFRVGTTAVSITVP